MKPLLSPKTCWKTQSLGLGKQEPRLNQNYFFWWSCFLGVATSKVCLVNLQYPLISVPSNTCWKWTFRVASLSVGLAISCYSQRIRTQKKCYQRGSWSRWRRCLAKKLKIECTKHWNCLCKAWKEENGATIMDALQNLRMQILLKICEK